MSITFFGHRRQPLNSRESATGQTVDVCRSHLDQSGPTAGSSNP